MELEKRNIDIQLFDVFILIIDSKNIMEEICAKEFKSFLPVINKPILIYQLEYLQRNQIKKVNLLVNKDDFKKLQSLIYFYSCSIQIDIIEITNYGTDIFNAIEKNRTQSDVILIEGDIILDFDLWKFYDSHLINDNLVTLILQKRKKESSEEQKRKKESSKEKKLEVGEDKTKYAFGLDENDNNHIILHKILKNKDDNLLVGKKLLNYSPNFKLVLNYIDVGIYIFNEKIFNLVKNLTSYYEEKNKSKKEIFENLKEKFIPFLINKSYSKRIFKMCNNENDKQKSNQKFKIRCKLIDNENGEEYCYKVYDYPSYLYLIEEIQKPYDNIRDIFFPTKNNGKNYFLNFENQIKKNIDNRCKFSENIPELNGISKDSYIHENITKIDKGISIEKSVINKNLRLGENSKIISCVIGFNCNIGHNCELTNCVIGNNTVIGDNCQISGCIIANDYKVEEKTNVSKEILGKNEN